MLSISKTFSLFSFPITAVSAISFAGGVFQLEYDQWLNAIIIQYDTVKSTIFSAIGLKLDPIESDALILMTFSLLASWRSLNPFYRKHASIIVILFYLFALGMLLVAFLGEDAFETGSLSDIAAANGRGAAVAQAVVFSVIGVLWSPFLGWLVGINFFTLTALGSIFQRWVLERIPIPGLQLASEAAIEQDFEEMTGISMEEDFGTTLGFYKIGFIKLLSYYRRYFLNIGVIVVSAALVIAVGS